MKKEDNIFPLPTTKTEIHSEFEEIILLVREKIMDIVFARIESEYPNIKRKRQILEELEAIVPGEC